MENTNGKSLILKDRRPEGGFIHRQMPPIVEGQAYWMIVRFGFGMEAV